MDPKKLETFEAPSSDVAVRFEAPEFTALCPKTGQPDFACIRIWYKPNQKCVELKSLKLYLWGFRDQGAFHEAVCERIFGDLLGVLAPQYLLVEADFWVRGGIHTVVHRSHGELPAGLLANRLNHFAYQAHG